MNDYIERDRVRCPALDNITGTVVAPVGDDMVRVLFDVEPEPEVIEQDMVMETCWLEPERVGVA